MEQISSNNFWSQLILVVEKYKCIDTAHSITYKNLLVLLQLHGSVYLHSKCISSTCREMNLVFSAISVSPIEPSILSQPLHLQKPFMKTIGKNYGGMNIHSLWSPINKQFDCTNEKKWEWNVDDAQHKQRLEIWVRHYSPKDGMRVCLFYSCS